MEKELTKRIKLERSQIFIRGLVVAAIVVMLLVAGAFGLASIFRPPNDDSNGFNDNDVPDGVPTENNTTPIDEPNLGFTAKLASTIQQNFVNISHIVVFQNITRDDTIIYVDAKFDKLDSGWNMTLFIMTIPINDLDNITVFDEPSQVINDSDVVDINSLVISGVNHTSVLNDTAGYDNYDPTEAAVFIQLLYANGTGFNFFLGDHPTDPIISFSVISWQYVDNYIDIKYPPEEVLLTPWSAFDPLFNKLDQLFSTFTDGA